MRQVTHQQHQEDYNKGYNTAVSEIQQLGWSTVRNNMLKKYPAPTKTFGSLAEYYTVSGYVDALLDYK